MEPISNIFISDALRSNEINPDNYKYVLNAKHYLKHQQI